MTSPACGARLVTCGACGFENPAEGKFCGSCGRRFGIRCAACGAESPPGFRFCGECGTAIGEARPAPEPRAYTPRHLAEKILGSRAALEGERKQVTVLFADVKGSMELAEQLDPEDWHRILECFFAILADGVHRFEGTVNQYTGDGIMALFGAPVAHEDHAQRACWAALHLRDALRRYADELRVQRGLSFAVRMGLNSGEVVVGRIGDDLRMDYTAQGHTVGLAQRMEQLAEPGKVLLTGHTARLVDGYFGLRDLGAARVKGVAEPLHVFELEGTGPLRTRLDLSRARGFSRFVGRAAEMELLDAALERAIAGEGQLVGVVAEPGIGKSRLCYEFIGRCRARGLLVREAHAVSHGQMIPFLPVLEILRAVFEIDERDSPRTARLKIAGALVLLDRQLEPAVPLIFDFLSVPDPERPSPALAPEERQRQLLDVVRRLIEGRSARQPGVTLIEDLHWIDRGSEAFFDAIAEVVGRTRTLFLVNFRPGYRAAWMGRTPYQSIPLQPLGREAIAELLRELLGTDPSLDGLAVRLEERTAGNPFFIEESVQALAEAGHLAGTRGAYRMDGPIERLVLPPTVQGVLGARIDRLPEREKRVLQAAAVIGKTFTADVLRQISDVAEPELEDALRRLVDAGLVYEQALYPERELAFKHPLTHEVAYGSQLGERRARTHADVARTLEVRHRDAPDAGAGELAHHWEQAGDAGRAVVWHRRAAAHAGYASARQSVAHWQKVRELAKRLEPSREHDEAAKAARIRLMMLGARVGMQPVEMAAIFHEGMALAERDDDEPVRARLLSAYAVYRVVAEGIVDDEMTADLAEAVRRIDLTDDEGLQVLTRTTYGWALAQRDHRALDRLMEEGLRRFADNPARGAVEQGIHPFAGFTAMRVQALGSLGRIREGLQLVDALGDYARRQGDPFSRFLHQGGSSALYGMMGDGAGMLAHARQAMAIAEPLENLIPQVLARNLLATAHNAVGEWAEAERLFLDLVMDARRQPIPRLWEGFYLCGLAEARLGRGDVGGALAAAEEAIELARRRSSTVVEVLGHLWLAHAHVRAGGASSAGATEAALGRVEELGERTGQVAILGRAAEVRAELAHALGDAPARVAHLREALRRYTEMGADGHAQRVAAELAR